MSYRPKPPKRIRAAQVPSVELEEGVDLEMVRFSGVFLEFWFGDFGRRNP